MVRDFIDFIKYLSTSSRFNKIGINWLLIITVKIKLNKVDSNTFNFLLNVLPTWTV